MKKVFDAGVPIVMGTDSGAPSGRFQGYFEHVELEYMVKAGMSPMQTLVASTSNVAKFLHQPDLGVIEPGKWADLLVLDANPLDDIKNTRKIDSVSMAGIAYRKTRSQKLWLLSALSERHTFSCTL